ILITGANGFIAREIIANLSLLKHEIIACVRSKSFINIPCSKLIEIDFKKKISEKSWAPYLENIDAVINCAGVFQTARDKTMWDIHYNTPKALFNACKNSGVKKIIQISALGIDKVDTLYAKTKLAADKYLESININSTIIRPSLVYSKGSYGGTSLLRGLSGFPFIIPVPGQSKSMQQPIHIDDLTHIVAKSLELPGKQILHAAGNEKLTLNKLLFKLRNWLGFKKVKTLVIPNIALRIGAKIGNFIHNSQMSETGIKMLSIDLTANKEEELNLINTIKFKPRGYSDGLNCMVSSVQDRWHAKLYFLKPLLCISIAFIWIFSGIVTLLPESSSIYFDLLNKSKIPIPLQEVSLYTFSIIDIFLGLATLFNFKLIYTGIIQISIILFYTLIISILTLDLWIHPLAPLAKNIPILTAILVMMALENDK
ncbi:SDR family oxidoreductase, partial [Gammaproteobacteria bacterium]|nr:SDR family oxidoreductase [Gammaproteobacteria bacterium]